MHLRIISQQKELLNIEGVEFVEYPGIIGKGQILNNHANMISVLKQGILTYEADNKTFEFEIGIDNAFLTVKDDDVNIIL